MNLALAQLAFRRCLPLGFFGAAVVVLAIAARIDWAPPAAWSAGTVRAGAFAREGVWTIGLVVLAPMLVHMSARTIARWRAGEVDWLAKSSARRGAILISTWLGCALAGAVVLAAIALTAELAARDTEPTWRIVVRTPAARGAIIDERTTLSWSTEPPLETRAARLQVGVALIPSAPSADLRLSATRHAPDGTLRKSQTRRRVSAATKLDVEVPDGEGAIEIELARQGEGAIVVLDGSGVAWLQPLGSAAWSSVDLAWIALLALAAWVALAIGLGAWLSSGLATCVLVALALPSWLGAVPELAAWLPWTDLPAAIELAGRGLGAPRPGLATWLGTVACVVLGLALARIDLATWRRNT